jgi:hypothetical protein
MGIPPKEDHSAFTTTRGAVDTFVAIILQRTFTHLRTFVPCSGSSSPRLFEKRSWRDPKVKKKDFDVGNLVLMWSPRTESSGNLKSKWEGTYVIIKKTRPRAYRLMDPQ